MRTILVIDPNLELRSFVCTILSRSGHNVLETHDVRLAGTILREKRVDVIVTDLAMPNRHGSETLEALRREFPNTEVITISGESRSTGYLRLAAALGAPRTLAQPFMSRELMGLLHEMVTGVAAYAAHVDYRAGRGTTSAN